MWQFQVTISLLEEAMLKGGKQQVLIDGFPRNEENRAAFEAQVIYCALAMAWRTCCPSLVWLLEQPFCQRRSWFALAHHVSGKDFKGRARCAVQTGIEPEFVLFFDCPEAVMEKRLLARQEGRTDDNIDTIRKRFKVRPMSVKLPAGRAIDLCENNFIILASLTSGEVLQPWPMCC